MASHQGELVGREAEMTALRRAAASADRGEPTGVVLVGEAGVGKSRLASELAGEVMGRGGIAVASHGVHLSGGELPFAGIAELVRGLVAAVGAAELTRRAGRELRALGAFDSSLGEVPGPDRADVTAALLAVLEGLGRERTVVWIVDDLQWLDAASRDLVGYALRVVRQARLLVVATVRDPPTGGGEVSDQLLELGRVPGVTTLDVRPLDDAAVDAQARSLSARPLDATELDRIRRLSDGLPFFVAELVGADGATPPTLRKAVTMSYRGLADETRLILRAVALEEVLARADLVAEVAGLTAAAAATAIAEARSRDILRVDRNADVLRFRHALLREAVEDEMLAGERRSLHRRWAEVIDQTAASASAPPGLLVARARHWHLAGSAEQAFPHVLAAARYVDRLEDQAAQAVWWERVLEDWDAAGDHPLVRDEAFYKLIVARIGIGDIAGARRVLAAELSGGEEPDRLRAVWLSVVGRHLAKLAGDLTSAPPPPAAPDELLAWLQGLGRDFRVNVTLHLLLHEWDGDRPDLYVPICDELARRGEAEGDLDGWLLAMRHRGWWLQAQGDFDGQLEAARVAREVVLSRHPARRLEVEWDWCGGLVEAGRYSEAVAACERAIEAVQEPRAVLYQWSILVALCAAGNSAIGRWEIALGWVHRAQDLAGESLGDAVASLLARLAGEIAARTGDVQLARARLRFFGSTPPDPAVPWSVLPCAGLSAEIGLIAGDRSAIDRALALIEDVRHAVGAPDEISQLLLSLSRTAEPGGRELLEQVLTIGDRLLPPGGQVASAVRAELAEHERRVAGSDTAVGWADVVATWRGLGRPYDAAWCGHLQALAAAGAGDRATATLALGEAWRIAGDLGAAPLRERIGATARRHRLQLEGLTHDTVADLTERETEVLRLIALGRTNAQIADELVISPKTASVHVSRILTKLGAANRTEAAAIARRLGVD